ncbi:MAG: FAD-binding oxidoreductase [Chloroflexota bacterium]|nr:FAD-binding oxidoreductase [Chloroflexota bacterium]
MADIVVIGAGVIGASIAANLARLGERPLVLERAHVCAGTTGQSGGVVRQHYSNPATAAMARDALAVFRSWGDYYDGDPHFEAVGVLLTAGPQTEESLRTNVETHRKLGIDTGLVSVDDIRKLDARINVDDCSALCLEPTAGIADTIATNHAFAETARNLGAIIEEGTAVTAIAVEGGRATGVETSRGFVAADVVVNSAGVWGPQLLRGLSPELPIGFSRHPMALVRRPPVDPVPHPVILDVHTDSYFLPKGDLSLIGKLGTMPEDSDIDPESYERGVSNDEIDRFLAAAGRRLPYLTRGSLLGGWAGIYDDSIDAHPVVDAVPGVEGLFCALGMSGNCFKLSPVIGELLARRIIQGDAAAPALDLFRYSRFLDGTTLSRTFSALSVMA